MPPALLSAIHYLDGLTERASLADLYALLRNSPLSLRDVEDHLRFDDHQYCCSRIAEGQWYAMLLVGWRSGQRSPIHDHIGSSCAFKVLAGVCSENVYGYDANGQVYPIENHAHETGAIIATQETDIHEVSNLQPIGQDLVTLHIYSPPRHSLRAFSLLEEGRRKPQVTEHLTITDGEGI